MGLNAVSNFKFFAVKKNVFSLVAILCVGMLAFAAATKDKTYSGTVGDALCGVEHSMPVSPVECIRQCLGKGSAYSLIVGDKVYVLKTEDAAILEILEKQAGEKVKVTGTDDGKSIAVKAVKPDTP
jgi:hypothetical protein